MHIVDLSDTPYMGTLSLQRNNPHSSRKSRGRVRCNARPPRHSQHAAPVTDGQGNELSIGKRRRNYKPTAPTVARKSDLERFANIIGTHDLTGD